MSLAQLSPSLFFLLPEYDYDREQLPNSKETVDEKVVKVKARIIILDMIDINMANSYINIRGCTKIMSSPRGVDMSL